MKMQGLLFESKEKVVLKFLKYKGFSFFYGLSQFAMVLLLFFFLFAFNVLSKETLKL